MNRIKEHGLQSRENQLFYTMKPRCTGHSGSFVSVSMVDCYPALLVLAYGAFAGFAFLLIEIMVHRRWHYVCLRKTKYISTIAT